MSTFAFGTNFGYSLVGVDVVGLGELLVGLIGWVDVVEVVDDDGGELAVTVDAVGFSAHPAENPQSRTTVKIIATRFMTRSRARLPTRYGAEQPIPNRVHDSGICILSRATECPKGRREINELAFSRKRTSYFRAIRVNAGFLGLALCHTRFPRGVPPTSGGRGVRR
ncbi:hypothetical protein [Amycolatopsis sp. CB00013]|uniref:hypothetical protein n=1 Tax=Amycolatopsis sp. CB00013 TaxID=1703945 RepID=UPI0011614D67|nr:hypothetical protein [Amycolatopsis sp. CB00013]